MMKVLRIFALVAMVASLFSQTHGKHQRQHQQSRAVSNRRPGLRCDANSVTAYIDRGAVQDVLEFSSELNAELHCNCKRGWTCRKFQFDVPFKHIRSYVNNLCANNVINPEILGEYITDYCTYHSGETMVEMAFECTTGCGIADHINQVCNTLRPVVPQAPSVSSDSSVTTDGESVTLTCSSASSGQDGFQWFLNGNPVAGASSDTYTTTVTTSNNGDEYACAAVVDGQRSDLSNSITLTVIEAPPAISGSGVAVDGESVTLTCSSDSSPLDGFQWFLNGSPVADASSDTYTANVTMSNNGEEYTCAAIIDGRRSAISNSTTLTVVPPAPSLGSVSSVTEGLESVTLTCSSASSGQDGFQWFLNGKPVADVTSDTYTTTVTTSNNGDEYVCSAVVDGQRSDLSNSITLTGPLPGTCNFDTDFCGWKNRSTNVIPWLRHTGQTTTGPTADHTSGYGHYAHVEAHAWKSSKFDSPSMRPVTGGVCVTFWYFLNKGPTTEYAELKMYTIAKGNNKRNKYTKVIEIKGPHIASWVQHTQYVAKPRSSFKVTFSGRVDEGGQLAVDDISFFDGLCSAAGYSRTYLDSFLPSVNY